MKTWSHPVASFWAGPELSFIEQMVIMSYLEKGCDFTLYVANPVTGIPPGTLVKSASEILEKPAFVDANAGRKALAVWSDIFRVALLRKRQVIWVDLDAYCLAPYSTSSGYLFGLGDGSNVLSGVIALPQDSMALQWMHEFLFREEFGPPPWRKRRKWARHRRRNGVLTPNDLPWGDCGPKLLTYALDISHAKQHASAQEVFYPLFRASLPRIWQSGTEDSYVVGSHETLSVHIFGYTKRFLATYHNGLPPRNSWLARCAERHGIDPSNAPAREDPFHKVVPSHHPAAASQ